MVLDTKRRIIREAKRAFLAWFAVYFMIFLCLLGYKWQTREHYRAEAAIKNLLKYLVTLIPYGKKMWDRSRQKLLGGLRILPQNFDDLDYENDWKDDFNDLSDLSIDSKHRVIYCVAKLIKK